MTSSRHPRPRYHGLGKYQVVKHLASGGMAAVYKAVEKTTGRKVALKVLGPDRASDPARLERFIREARCAAQLHHENIVTLFEAGSLHGIYYMVLELVEGVDLLEYIQQQGQLNPEDACRILLQAARALEYLHGLGIVHRDIKPQNFLIRRKQGHFLVKLTDLGLARDLRTDETLLLEPGTTIGTIDYLAPEQARDCNSADIRSDLYGLGCTAYHMLAGRPPFPDGAFKERAAHHARMEPPDLRSFNPKVTEPLMRVVQRLMAKRPEDRYQNPTELIQDLARNGLRSSTKVYPAGELPSSDQQSVSA